MQPLLKYFICIFLLLLLKTCDSVDDQFFQSARTGEIELLNDYIAKGVSVNSRDSKGNSPLVIASGRGHVNVISLLLDHGAYVNDYTQVGLFEGKTALCWAASQGRPQAVAALLQAGADPNYQSEKGVFSGKTTLMWASSQGRSNVVRLLISAGVDVNFSSKIGNFKGKSSLKTTLIYYTSLTIYTKLYIIITHTL